MRFRVVTILLVVLLESGVGQMYWIPLPSPTSRNLRKLAFLDSLQGWVAGDSGTILRTTNGGQTWLQQNSGITDNIVDLFFLNERLGWAIAPWYLIDSPYTPYTQFLSTTNGGTTWQNEYWLGDFFTSVHFTDSLVGYLGSGLSRILKTTNGGSTWTETVIEPGPHSRLPVQRVKFFSPNYGFATGGRLELTGVIWRTTTAGDTWRASPVAPDLINDLHFFDSLDIFGVYSDPDQYGTGVVVSTDGGDNWTYRFVAIWGDARAIAPRTRAEMWAPLGFASTYMYTLDSGATWTELYTPDTTEVYDAVFTDERNGYMVGARGTVLKYNYTSGTEQPDQFSLPHQPILHQNFPNPFNPSTTIRFDIARSSFVCLKVYNVVGQEVLTLVNETKLPGIYQVPVNGEVLPGGVYFYRLSTDSFIQTKKFVLLR